MTRTIASVILLFAGWVQPVHGADFEAVNRHVDGLVALLSDEYTQEPAANRRITPVELDGRYLYAAIFSLSGTYGGSGGGSVLALFESTDLEERSKGASAPATVRLVAFIHLGHKGWRQLDPETLHVAGGMLVFSGHEQLPSDPQCCPSKPVEVRFVLRNEHLVEQGPGQGQ